MIFATVFIQAPIYHSVLDDSVLTVKEVVGTFYQEKSSRRFVGSSSALTAPCTHSTQLLSWGRTFILIVSMSCNVLKLQIHENIKVVQMVHIEN